MRVWDVESGALIHVLEDHDSSLSWFRVSADGASLMTGTRDRNVYAWDLEGGGLRAVLSEDGEELQMSIPIGDDRILTSSGDRPGRVGSLTAELPPLRSNAELLHESGALTNLRVCRKTGEVVPVLPFPEPESVWAPQRLCIPPRPSE